jgi:membrane-associated phospholipid phosphatase
MKLGFNRNAHTAMRLFSLLFSPFQGTFIAFVVLFFFTYLTHIPLLYRLFVLLLIYLFTILLPTFGLYLYRRINGWQGHSAFRHRHRRFIPYTIAFVSYILCLWVMEALHLPRYMYGIVVGTAIAIALSGLCHFRWKVSEHLISMGGAVAIIVEFSSLVGYNPLLLLCVSIVASGLLGFVRITLKHHTLGEVLLGFAIGFLSLYAALTYYM